MTQIKLNQELNEIKKLIKNNFINGKEVLTSNEALSYLNISYSMLTKLTSNNIIPFYKPTNGLLFFFKDELHTWIKENKVFTEKDAENLVKNHRKNNKA
ncbi:helix-turn-helix domain-containing protein [Elizabethkingia anophelis]|nr:helix-turn-helix domain-containing protein [Elizabethkingia anophelis]MCT3635277.1 helix-turn-helix domain-containing protein [Elizabethkingia anophelis]MCT3831918.1 helix-turn-helix domain-containing protein [Elizabethkingia anophelis]MCT3885482.1 helix-turn-helix domain-containing protein [Elizabethkingia anophelis]MCT3896249.1 helix-turn-helix domain-containing protein [Elizabethkingia anophelis]